MKSNDRKMQAEILQENDLRGEGQNTKGRLPESVNKCSVGKVKDKKRILSITTTIVYYVYE
jgi:hypothetical protein